MLSPYLKGQLRANLINQLDTDDSFLLDQEVRPLKPTTLNFELVDLTAVDLLFSDGLFPVEKAFLELFVLEGFTAFTDFDAWTDVFACFVPDGLLLDFWFETLVNFGLLTFCGVMRERATSLRTLSTLRDSKLSFFFIASSIRVANIRFFLATKLVTFPVIKELMIFKSTWEYD